MLIPVTVIFILCCQTRKASTVQEFTVPEILIRPQVIGPQEEMGYVLDNYNRLVKKITTNPSDVESWLSLAELFMMERLIRIFF